MKIIRARDLTRTPWKNGGGETMEIAVYPVDAKLDDFEWRVSMAIVSSGGPFSHFPQIDRTLTVLQGGPITLSINDEREITLTSTSGPLSFPGDGSISARLEGDEVTDLNVMTRRGIFGHRVTPMVIDRAVRVIEVHAPFFILVRSGAIQLIGAGKSERLEQYDSSFFDEAGVIKVEVQSDAAAHLLAIAIFAEH
jgi:uncharacterized protein